MLTRRELTRALAERVHSLELLASAWTLDNLQVYGDHLQEREDPRGELVAIDLHIAREGPSPELLHRKRNRLRSGFSESNSPWQAKWTKSNRSAPRSRFTSSGVA